MGFEDRPLTLKRPLSAAFALSLALALLAAPGTLPAQEPPAAEPAAESGDPAAEQAEAAADAMAAEMQELLLSEIPNTPPPSPIASAEVADVPNDNGQGLGVGFDWAAPPAPETPVRIELKPDPEILEEFRLSDSDSQRLAGLLEKLASELGTLISDLDAANAQLAAADEARTVAQNAISQTNDHAGLAALNRDYWKQKRVVDDLQSRIDQIRNRFAARGGRKLLEKQRQYDYLSAALDNEWLPSNGAASAGSVGTRAALPAIFGMNPPNPEQPYLIASELAAPLPPELAAQAEQLHTQYGEDLNPALSFPLETGRSYEARLVVGAAEGEGETYYVAGSAAPRSTFFKSTLVRHFVPATIYALIIMTAIMLARRNPNLFIRRIAGLEAVDEAIGRATEMGKPVLYLNGMNDLSDLATLAAVNILGRVSRRIADYDSELLVPCRDPVVFTVAQEVVKQGYTEQGRPDAFKGNNIYFVTDDQFSYTASVCAIMIRERPAANFFMGYYYAESLLLAETGAGTGAIQIAGTDSPNQLPFFITTCDYTLIGEELYAASAYLSREPLLLGSLKGQDVGKAVMMLIILLQTILFVAQFVSGNAGPNAAPWDFIVRLIRPL